MPHSTPTIRYRRRLARAQVVFACGWLLLAVLSAGSLALATGGLAVAGIHFTCYVLLGKGRMTATNVRTIWSLSYAIVTALVLGTFLLLGGPGYLPLFGMTCLPFAVAEIILLITSAQLSADPEVPK